MHQDTPHTCAAQWGLLPAANGSFQFVHRLSRLCLQADMAGLLDNAPIAQQVCLHCR